MGDPNNQGKTPGRAPFGVPADEFVADGKKANAKAQLVQATKIFNDAVRAAKTEGLFFILELNKNSQNAIGLGFTKGGANLDG